MFGEQFFGKDDWQELNFCSNRSFVGFYKLNLTSKSKSDLNIIGGL